ncbi:MAG: hypothetical protein JST48_08760 [Bacteroidetes bacterium]|nr:hypothetical protein [Bacteroidota bacterium]
MDFFFNQIIGDGANLFFVIVAILIGFVGGLAVVDKTRTEEKEKGNRPF